MLQPRSATSVQKTGHQNGQRSETRGKLDPWSPLPLEAVIPFRDFGQQARGHWAEPFRASRIDLLGGRKRPSAFQNVQGRNLAPSAAGPFVWERRIALLREPRLGPVETGGAFSLSKIPPRWHRWPDMISRGFGQLVRRAPFANVLSWGGVRGI